MNFKKRRKKKISFATFKNVFMHALFKILIVYGISIVTAPITHFSLSLAYVVVTATTTSQCIYDIPSVTREIVTNFKRRVRTFERDFWAFL